MVTLTPELLTALLTWVDTPPQFQFNYPGRGLFDEPCVGIIGPFRDAAALVEAARQLAAANPDNTAVAALLAAFRRTAMNNKGPATIYYWTELTAAPELLNQ